MASAPLLSAATKLPEWIGSPIADSTLTLSRFTASEQELTELHGLLSNPELWIGGYDLSGKLPDIANAEELWHAMEELWLADGLELMVIQRDGGFAGITGVMEWSTASTLGGWTVLTGRTVIAPELWGSCANEESKIMLYSELFSRGVEAVECSVSATNARSLRAVSKFGFRELHREPRIVEGEPREFVRFGIPVANWAELRERNIDRILQRRLNHELELQQNR